MKWKFWDKKNPLTDFDPHLIAFAILQRMREHKPPFNEWRAEGVKIPADADAFVELSVWAYQLTIFLDCLERKFGSDTAQIVKSHLVTLAGRWDKKQFMSSCFDAVMLGRSLTQREQLFCNKPEIQVDANIAKALLAISPTGEEEKTAIYMNFGHALSVGRLSAEMRFTSLVNKMEFRPESVMGLRKPEEISVEWSEAPGCFERHLQRRHRNPLFPIERRAIANADVVIARARDKADLGELRLRIWALAEKVVNLKGTTTFHECVVLREEIENLLLRCAEVSGGAAEEKAKLQSMYDGLVDMMRQACSPENRQKLDDAIAQSASLQRMHGHEFFAQLRRSDTPICGGDVIPSLLSESVETIRMYVSYFGKENHGLDRAVIEEAARILGGAEKEGYAMTDAEQKLLALNGETPNGR